MNGQKKDLDLIHIIIRVPKAQSSFTYFMFESHEGLCFYSTLDHEKGQLFRDIDLKGSLEFKDDIDHLLNKLGEQFPLEILTDEIIKDGASNQQLI